MKTLLTLLLIAILSIFGLAAYTYVRASTVSDVYKNYTGIPIDLRQTPDDGDRSIWFCAKPGFPGHAFILLTDLDSESGKRNALTLGIYPDTDKKNQFLSSSMVVTDESTRPEGLTFTGKEPTLIVKVSKHDYERIQSMLPKTGKQLGIHYALVTNDCLGLAIDVAKSLEKSGLKVPERALFLNFPSPYIEELIRVNTLTNQSAHTTPASAPR
ncbi:hypothetical protein [Pelagicoccus sp. SDUM812003]|uniref:hypothetical protein n=1 Tax=Pelagicoccus sp. SDUM812003 TaxID=3041267 RepID=UPI00280DBA4A|nr:hypothetical protein [Pelagicoccus sp. SDUM812003]MDQ8205775.1 hypothetical protein [Pelagicoccus sp. SDUM812003]